MQVNVMKDGAYSVKSVSVNQSFALGASVQLELILGESRWALDLYGSSDPYTLIKLLEDNGVSHINLTTKKQIG